MARLSSYREIRARNFALEICVAFNPAEIAGDWRRLEEEGCATAFQTRRWLEPLARIAAPAEGAEPFYVLVRERISGAPQMLLPLCLRRCGALCAIEFLDLGASDYNAPLIASSFRPSPAEFTAFWSSIRSALPPADILRIDKSPAAIAGAPNPLAQLRFMRRLPLGAWSVALPHTREAYDREILSARFRKELRRKRRRLEACGALRLAQARDAAEAFLMLRELADMRRKRYAALGRNDILGLAAFRAFYEELLSNTEGLAEIHALEIDGQRVAIQFGLRRGGAFHFLLSGFRGDEWAQKSVGSVAADMMIAQAIDEGLATFDFTIGNAPYKRYFGAVRHDLYGGAQALSYRALPEVAERRIKSSLRAFLLPPSAEPRALSPDHWR